MITFRRRTLWWYSCTSLESYGERGTLKGLEVSKKLFMVSFNMRIQINQKSCKDKFFKELKINPFVKLIS